MLKYASTIDASRTLLKASVQLKAGNTREAFKLFASLKEEEGFDEIMDGIAKGAKRLEAMDDEELNDALDNDSGYDDGDDDEDDADISAGDDDDYDDMDIDLDDDSDGGDDSGDDEDQVAIPASVAEFLGLDS